MFAKVTGIVTFLLIIFNISRVDSSCDEDLIKEVVGKLLAAKENQHSEMSDRIRALENIVTNQQARISVLDNQVRLFRKSTGNIKRIMNSLQAQLESNQKHFSEENMDKYDVDFDRDRLSDGGQETHISNNGINLVQKVDKLDGSDSKIRKIRAAENVAFSAYLSRHIDHMSPGYHIVLDKVILNDSNGYNENTGIFTVPVSGVYLFTFNINDHLRKTTVQLVLDGNDLVDVISDPDSSSEEAMSGNTAIVRVTVGQSVWLQAYLVQDGSLWSDVTGKFTTFSGVLLY